MFSKVKQLFRSVVLIDHGGPEEHPIEMAQICVRA